MAEKDSGCDDKITEECVNKSKPPNQNQNETNGINKKRSDKRESSSLDNILDDTTIQNRQNTTSKEAEWGYFSRRRVLQAVGLGASVSGLPIGFADAQSESGFVDILSIDPSSYPLIQLNIAVDTEAGRKGELTEDDFTIIEEEISKAVKSFTFTSTSLDLAFVFDDTGSMGDEIGEMKRKVIDLTNQIENADIDARYGLVSFKDSVDVDLTFTDDADQLETAVDSLNASGGDDAPEDNFDAIEAALNFDFRDGAQKVIVDITDNVSHYRGDGSGFSEYTIDEVAEDLQTNGIAFFAVAPSFGDSEESKRTLADMVDGRWIDITSADFSVILEEITETVISSYLLGYETSISRGEDRLISVEVEDPEEGTGSDSGDLVVPPGDSTATARFNYSPTEPYTGQDVTFDASDSDASDAEIESYEWDMDNDGDVEVTGESVTYAFEEVGEQTVTLRVTDSNGNQSSTEQIIDVVPFEQGVAEAFAPEFGYDADEPWYPTDPRNYIDEGEVEVYGPTALNEYHDGYDPDSDPPPDPTIFYHVVGITGEDSTPLWDQDLIAVQYWRYYVFDQFSVNYHWHDSEKFHIFLDMDSDNPFDFDQIDPILYVASAHGSVGVNNEYLDQDASIEQPTGVLSELGAHASAPDVNSLENTFERYGTESSYDSDITNNYNSRSSVAVDTFS
ncbi:VWA domain-containing protein [Halobacteriaceae archaeon SHR40]|uniref:VWA domain-containing protein n=1 Tax=Halovenus amylolytica TaxID=2500550 RepID=UPI000FE2B6E7